MELIPVPHHSASVGMHICCVSIGPALRIIPTTSVHLKHLYPCALIHMAQPLLIQSSSHQQSHVCRKLVTYKVKCSLHLAIAEEVDD